MKPIANFENRYMISNKGEVLNLANNMLMSPTENPNGYYKVGLAKGNGEHKQFSIHRLVALHFIPNPYGYTQVNHINGNKQDNNFLNLEWCTPKENIHHAFESGLRKGYMSANDKENYLKEVLNGAIVADIANRIGRHPNTLSGMLRRTAERLGLTSEWKATMVQRRKDAAIRNLKKINN